MKNTWQQFENPAWQAAAAKRPQGSLGSVWRITKTDTRQERQHKLRVKDWLFKNNLTEELLLNHPSPDDIVLLREIRISTIYDYFTPSDVAKLGCIEHSVVIKRKSLTATQLEKINQATIRAQRLQKRNIRRLGTSNGRTQYQNYLNKIDEIG